MIDGSTEEALKYNVLFSRQSKTFTLEIPVSV